MLSDEELDAALEDGMGIVEHELFEEIVAQAREANRYRRDHEAMQVLRETGGRVYTDVRPGCWTAADAKGRGGGEWIQERDPADALIAWRDKYMTQEPQGCLPHSPPQS